jgi:hypothetical protein
MRTIPKSVMLILITLTLVREKLTIKAIQERFKISEKRTAIQYLELLDIIFGDNMQAELPTESKEYVFWIEKSECRTFEDIRERLENYSISNNKKFINRKV